MSGRVGRKRAGVVVVARCSCGRTYDRESWLALHLVGVQRDAVESVELRDCVACPSTLGISTVITQVTYAIEPGPHGGFVVWRRAGSGDEIAIGFGTRATVFRSESEAEATIAAQRRADIAAATRLGVIVDDDDERAA